MSANTNAKSNKHYNHWWTGMCIVYLFIWKPHDIHARRATWKPITALSPAPGSVQLYAPSLSVFVCQPPSPWCPLMPAWEPRPCHVSSCSPHCSYHAPQPIMCGHKLLKIAPRCTPTYSWPGGMWRGVFRRKGIWVFFMRHTHCDELPLLEEQEGGGGCWAKLRSSGCHWGKLPCLAHCDRLVLRLRSVFKNLLKKPLYLRKVWGCLLRFSFWIYRNSFNCSYRCKKICLPIVHSLKPVADTSCLRGTKYLLVVQNTCYVTLPQLFSGWEMQPSLYNNS